MILRDEITKEPTGIQCDEPKCAVVAPDQSATLSGGGLNNMGWHCMGGTHYCPAHADAHRG